MKKQRWAILAVAVVVAGGFAVYRSRPTAEVGSKTRQPGPSVPQTAEPAHASFLYGRVHTIDGSTYEGRLRWGGGQEAFWGDHFNGAKRENRWAEQIPPEQLPKVREPLEIFGVELGQRERTMELKRLFLARFGDVARIEASGRDVKVRLKSGTETTLNRMEASDFDDGVRVWDARQGVVDVDSLRIRAIEFLASPESAALPPVRLQGTVRTKEGDAFTGFVQWNRTECLGSDELVGWVGRDQRRIRFERIRAIERQAGEEVVVRLREGAGWTMEAPAPRGLYVDDPRYGRVLVSWDALERVEFEVEGSGPGYNDFPPGRPLRGTVTAGDGRRLAGRLVFDLDESEDTETLDAPARGVDYMIGFDRVEWIELPRPERRESERARVKLRGGQELALDCKGDLGVGNAGVLVMTEGGSAEYMPWGQVAKVEFEGSGTK